ncbi:hypothetical protein EMPG_17691 [Blastomyces silverae]|uniref:Uncharacterized protein n=1 Tax=Blastomyces silverae TaxID=2060906 RepID=A0A0H1BC99_9EURO|nr:hypothetical protein EMPG_17691 [Blastomyces silverae]
MASESVLQPVINRIDLSGEWDGNPSSQVALHAKIEFVSAPNTRLRLLDLSNDGVELLQYDGPTKLLDASRLPHHLEEISDEKPTNRSAMGCRRGRERPDILKGIESEGTEPLNETPRTLYRKGMELSPPPTRRRLFPPSPTSTLNRLPSFDELMPTLDNESVFSRDDEDDGYDGGASRSADISATDISESSGTNSAAQSLDTARAINGDLVSEMEAMLADLKGGMNGPGGFGDLPITGLYGAEKENKVTDTCNRATSLLSSPTKTPKPQKGAVSRIPVKAQRQAKSSSPSEELSHSSESEGNFRYLSDSPSKTASPPSDVFPVPGNETPSLIPSTPRNEQFSPVKLSNTLPADLNKHWVDQESPQSPTRKFSCGVVRQVPPLFDRFFPQPDLTGSRRNTQRPWQSDVGITTQERESGQKDNDKAVYVSTWLEENEGDGFLKEYSQPRPLHPTRYSTEHEKGHKENSPTSEQSRPQSTDILGQSQAQKPVTLQSPSTSSQLSMPWNSAEDLANKSDLGQRLHIESVIPAPELAIVEELGRDFYILSPETSVPTAYTIKFDLKVKLGPLQPGGWQLLKIPGLQIEKQGGKGTVKLAILHSSVNKKLDCRAGGLLSVARDGAGFIADFDIAEPFALSMRAVELLTSESRDNRILNHEISMVLRRHQKALTRAVVEYTAVCALSLYQKILCADEGFIPVIISDGPGGDFEWTMEKGNRDFRVAKRAANASDIGTTKIRIFCKEDELHGCFRITWEVPYGAQISQTWVPKLFFEKPATQAEYAPLLRSELQMQPPGNPVFEEETESEENTPVETEKAGSKWEQDDLEDLGYLGLPTFETESMPYWCVHQLVRVVLFSMAIMQELSDLVQIYVARVPLGSMKIIIISVVVVQAMVLVNQQLGLPSIESQISQQECPGPLCPRSYVQIEPRLGSFNWFAREKASVIDRGLLGHIFNVVNGREVTFMDSENIRSAENDAGEQGDMQINAVQAQITREVGAAPRTGTEGRYDPTPISTSNSPLTKLKNNAANSRTASEPTTTSTAVVAPTKVSLRDRIDMFFGWNGPLE